MLKKIIKILKKDFIKNVGTLIVGTGSAQLIAFLFQLISRRLFSPEEFGAFAVYFSLFSVLVTVSTLQYSRTIILPKKDISATQLLVLSVSIAFITGIIYFLVFYIFNDRIGKVLGLDSKYSGWLIFVALSVFLYSTNDALNYWLIRKKAFRHSAIGKSVRRSTEGVSQSIFGLFRVSKGLVFGDIIGSLINFIYLFNKSIKNGLLLNSVSLTGIKQQSKRYKEFPIYNSIPAVLNKVSLFLPVLLINRFFSPEITGFFDLSRVVLALPISLISLALSQNLLQYITVCRNNDKSFVKSVFKLIFGLGVMAVLGVLVINLLGNYLFIIFGKEWIGAAQLANILVFSYGIKFIVSPFSIVFTALERIKLGSIWQIFYFGSISLLFLIDHSNIMVFLKKYIIIEIICYLIYLILIVAVIMSYENNLKKKSA